MDLVDAASVGGLRRARAPFIRDGRRIRRADFFRVIFVAIAVDLGGGNFGAIAADVAISAAGVGVAIIVVVVIVVNLIRQEHIRKVRNFNLLLLLLGDGAPSVLAVRGGANDVFPDHIVLSSRKLNAELGLDGGRRRLELGDVQKADQQRLANSNRTGEQAGGLFLFLFYF